MVIIPQSKMLWFTTIIQCDTIVMDGWKQSYVFIEFSLFVSHGISLMKFIILIASKMRFDFLPTTLWN